MLGLEEQAAAMAGTVTGHMATPELQQFAAHMRAQAGDAQRMRELMGGWHQPTPAPYSPGASLPAGMMGTGMMDAADWAEISHESQPNGRCHLKVCCAILASSPRALSAAAAITH